MPTSGCPESINHGWGTGYIRFTTTSKIDVWTESRSTSGVQRMSALNDSTELAGSFKSFSFELNFCFKHKTQYVKKTTSWSDLKISVFGDDGGCPNGFFEEINKLQLPPIKSWQTDGYLPYFEILHENNETQIVTRHCHQNSSIVTMPVRYDTPFISVKVYGDSCASNVKGYNVEEKTVQLEYLHSETTLQPQYTNLSFCIYRPKAEILYHSTWPNGPYAVLMLNTGCPEPLEYGWDVGYIQFKTLTSHTDFPEFDECKDIMCLGRMLELYHSSGSQLFFCSKREQHDNRNDVEWPQGQYSIFAAKKDCPRGFTESKQPRVEFNAGDSLLERGTLPYFTVADSDQECDGLDFQCKDGECIRHKHRCDYDNDCGDSDDEENCTYRCFNGQLSCDNKCMEHQLVCDGVQNCTAGSDELQYHCGQKCYGYEFKCGSGECVKKRFICDDIKDCKDGSDETYDNCDIRCAGNTFYCRHSRKCISKRRLCDGTVDCDDGFDENESICPSICQPKGIYMGRNFRRNVHRSVCMSEEEDTQSETAWGLREFCRNSNRCERVKDLCDELLSLLGDSQAKQSTTSCHRGLGLRDGNIDQFGAKSSITGHHIKMVRPSKSSWCPRADDKHPYLWVYFDDLTIVGGIVVYNRIVVKWQTVNDSYTPEVIPLGCGSFSVQYATSSSLNYMEYSTGKFELDKSKRIREPQTFLFLRPFFAKYVRIYLHDKILNGRLCLRLELLGCAKLADFHGRFGFGKLEETNIVIPGSGSLSLGKTRFLSDRTYKWNISAQGADYVTLHFSQIDLFNQSAGRCPYDVLSFDDLFEPISSLHNGLELTYPTDKQQLSLTFVSCLRQEDSKSGFIADVYTESIPTIWGQIKGSNLLEGKLSTLSLLGLFINLPKKHTWNLDSMLYGRPLVFSIETFNIPCNTGYKPPTQAGQFGMYSVHSEKLRKYYNFSYQVAFEDGKTQAKQCHANNYHLPVIHTREEMEFLQSWVVYRISDHFTTYKARSSLYLRSRDDFQWSPHVNIYVHIGLLRYWGISGLKEIWQDGTLLSYTAWDTDEPKHITVNRCTGMLINMTTGEARWVSRLCNENSITPDFLVVSLCEKTSNAIPPADNVSNEEDPFQTNKTTTASVSFKPCNSTEWLSPLAICDGINDCHDGSDERDCPGVKHEDCSEDMFRCKSGECIHIGQVCNFIDDCPDKSDEYCVMPACGDQEYRCSNNQCIQASQHCNAVEDCHDGSDEVLCLKCNDAFSCGDFTCINESLRCDSIPDCANARDETNCNKDIRTCFDLWEVGYDEDAKIDRSGHYLECQYNVTKDALLITTFVDVKSDWKRYENNEVRTFENKDFEEFGDHCSMEIHVKKYVDEHWQTDRYSINLTNGTFSGENVNNANFAIFVHGADVYIRRRTNLVSKFEHFTIQPAKCIAEIRDIGQWLRCGNGKRVPLSRKCVYEVNHSGIIDGCRNYKHLQNCENFNCTAGFYKCPTSFCLAKRYVCDGERQCPGGEDENGCWCDGNNYVIVVIYSESANKTTVPYIHQFTRQLPVSKNDYVDIVRYTFDKHASNFTVKKSRLHPYNEALYLGEIEQFIAVKNELYAEIMEHYKEWSGVTIINIEQYEWHAFKTDFHNLSVIDKVFEITIDPNIMKRVKKVNTDKGFNVIFRSWKLLASVGSALFPDLCKGSRINKCKNQFRCASSKICIPVDKVCDNTTHCPFGDDEMMCDFQCHKKCTCDLYRINCSSADLTSQHFDEIDSSVRVLDISENEMFVNGTFVIPKRFPYLIHLMAKSCGIISVTDETFLNAINIRHLDLSFNNIKFITTKMLHGLKYLDVLQLKGNADIERIEPKAFQMLTHLSALSITHTKISEIQPDTFYKLKVKTLNISHNKIRKIHTNAFRELSAEVIDFSENDINDFDPEIFNFVNKSKLKTIRSSAYKFCCVKPDSVPDKACWPHQDEFSSCEDLMRHQILQTLIWVLGAAALIANASTILYRLLYDRKCFKKGFGMFVTNLAASDFLMGIYMMIIAIADITFRDRYIMMDDYWRHSGWCNLAGVLATVSSEASVLFMCLITVDRILVIKYPFGQWRFGSWSSKIATLTSWIFSWIIALIPITIETYFKGMFYSTSGVCLALPLTHRRPPGWLYSFLVYVALNFIAFTMIAIGQLVIYLEIRKTSERMKKVRSQRRNDVRIAKNLLLVLSTDFLCWFPVGVMGIMAASGHVIPGDTYAWTAVFIVPINAALNPFLYTLSAVLRQKTSSVTSTSREESVTKDFKVQCSLDVKFNNALATSAITDSPKKPVYLTLDELQAKRITLSPREVLSAYLAIVRNMAVLHKTNYVYGGVSKGNCVYSTETGQIRMLQPEPRRWCSKHDKDSDVKTAGIVLEYMLKLTKPSD